MPDKAFEVFISHFTEESAIAEELQSFLSLVFGIDLRVFRSSDDGSIRTGADQYEEILNALRSAKVVIVLLSRYSWKRPWVNFEAGFAKASGSAVFTILVRGTKPDEIGTPISQIQLRALSESVVKEVLRAIELQTARSSNVSHVSGFIEAIHKIEARLPDAVLRVTPTICSHPDGRRELRFEILYQGTRPIELEKIEAEVPRHIMRADAFTGGAAGHLEVSAEQRDGQHHLRKVRWANDAPPGDDGRYFGHQPLRRLLHPNEVPQLLSEPKFELVRDAQSNFSDATIRFRLFTRDGVADFQPVPLKDVPAATTPCR